MKDKFTHLYEETLLVEGLLNETIEPMTLIALIILGHSLGSIAGFMHELSLSIPVTNKGKYDKLSKEVYRLTKQKDNLQKQLERYMPVKESLGLLAIAAPFLGYVGNKISIKGIKLAMKAPGAAMKLIKNVSTQLSDRVRGTSDEEKAKRLIKQIEVLNREILIKVEQMELLKSE